MVEQERQSDDRERLGARARRFFDDLWTQRDDWKLETSEFDQRRHARSLQLLEDRRYARALEIGGETVGYLLRPWLISTYRDLFLNVGFQPEHEEVFRGAKDGIQLEALITLLQRPVLDRNAA